MADKRTAEDIERDLERARQRLAENLSQLVTEIHPKAVVHRTVTASKRQARRVIEEGKQNVRDSFDRVKRVFKDESGWNMKSLAVAGVAAAALVAVAVLTRKK